MKQRLVVIGNGMAPGRVLEGLFDADPHAFDVTIFNAEPRDNYDRIMLSPVLAGEKDYADIVIHDAAWYAARGITVHRGRRVVAIDRAARRVIAADGTTADYDRLLIATGSTPVVLPLPGRDLAGVLTYRDLDDVNAMVAAARRGGRAVVIGGGVLGLEAAAGLRARGMAVTLLHLAPTLMNRQLDPAAGALLREAIAARGIEVITAANTHRICGDTHVEAVVLDDGRRIDCTTVVMAVGIRPSTALAAEAGLSVGRGILVDDAMCTSDPAIHAVGECVEHRGVSYGLVAPLYEMAAVVADRLTGGSATYTGSVTATRLKVTGIDLFSAGDFAGGPGREDIVLRDPVAGVYKRVVLEEGRLVGVVLYGDTADGAWFFKLMRQQSAIAALRDTLIFGPTFAGGSPLDPMVAVAASPADRTISGCSGLVAGFPPHGLAGAA